jgi:hypothetical protein
MHPTPAEQKKNQELSLKMLGLIGAGGGVIGLGALFFAYEVTQLSFMGAHDSKYSPKLPPVPAQKVKDAAQCDPKAQARWLGCMM